MKKYDSYKDSGIEWIGEIPSHWKISKLKFAGKSFIGIIYSPDDVVSDGDGTLVLRSSNIQDGKLAFEDNVFVNKTIQEKYFTKQGDILLCARNGSAHLVGKSAFIGKENEGLAFGAFMSIVRSELGKYLYYFFNSQIFKAQSGLFSTSTINQLTSDTLNNLFISFPKNINEQTAIANYLDRKTAEIDQLIADKKRLLALYDEEKTVLINKAVTKGINPDAKMKDSGIEWLGEIPEHWEVIPMTKYLESIVDYRGRTPKKQNEGLFLVTARNVKNRIIDYSLSEEFVDAEDAQNLLDRGKPKIGDVLFTTEAPLGEVANIDREDIALAQRIIKFRGKYEMLDNYYLMFFLSSDCFRQDLYSYSTGSTAIGIKASKLHNLKCLLPPLTEQQSIVRHIETECALIDAKKTKTEKLIELLTEYRTALISEVVTGKIKIT